MNRTARLLRLLLPGGNPLARGSDRLHGTLLIGVVALGLALVPVMLTFGSLTYSGLVDTAAQQSRDWQRTVALVTEDTTAAGAASRGEPVATATHVMAEWPSPDGTTRTGRVPGSASSLTGADISPG